MKRFSVAVVTVIAALSSIPAAAETASIRVEGNVPNALGANQLLAKTVQYGDLDITTGSGAAELLGRIDAASLAICGDASAAPARLAGKISDCRKRAIATAVQRLDSPVVTQTFAAR